MKRITIALILLVTVNLFAQVKPDSTEFKTLVKELQQLQLQKARADSMGLKLQGAIEYTYSKAVEAQKKLQGKTK